MGSVVKMNLRQMMLELCSNVRLEEYIFGYIYLIRLILKKFRREERESLV